MGKMMVVNLEAKTGGFVRLRECCENLTFCGAKNNGLLMVRCQSIYALHVEADGAV